MYYKNEKLKKKSNNYINFRVYVSRSEYALLALWCDGLNKIVNFYFFMGPL